jgi:hypothetical protein
MDLEEYIEGHIHEVVPDRRYLVTFQEIQHGNKKVVMDVEYRVQPGELARDDWEEHVIVGIHRREGMSPSLSEMLWEQLAVNLDEDYFDDTDDEEDSDDETLSIASQPLTPPPSRERWV